MKSPSISVNIPQLPTFLAKQEHPPHQYNQTRIIVQPQAPQTATYRIKTQLPNEATMQRQPIPSPNPIIHAISKTPSRIDGQILPEFLTNTHNHLRVRSSSPLHACKRRKKDKKQTSSRSQRMQGSFCLGPFHAGPGSWDKENIHTHMQAWANNDNVMYSISHIAKR